jgi:hypothetical protein
MLVRMGECRIHAAKRALKSSLNLRENVSIGRSRYACNGSLFSFYIFLPCGSPTRLMFFQFPGLVGYPRDPHPPENSYPRSLRHFEQNTSKSRLPRTSSCPVATNPTATNCQDAYSSHKDPQAPRSCVRRTRTCRKAPQASRWSRYGWV